MSGFIKSIAAGAAMLAALGASASAATLVNVTGKYFRTSELIRNLADADAVATTAPLATFNVTAIDYPNAGAILGNSSSLAQFLGVDAASIVGPGADTLSMSVFVFEGFLDLGAQAVRRFSVGSDDGFRLTLDGNVISQFDGERTFDLTEVALASGGSMVPFTLIFFENWGEIGLEFRINDRIVSVNPVPLPAAPLLMLTGLGVIGVIARRRRPA